MIDTALDGLARNQTASNDAAPAAPGQRAHVPAHAQILRTLLTAAQTAREVYGISERKLHDLRAKGLVPDPVVLGERSLRWVRNECEAHALTLPRQRGTQEVPPQLRRKIEHIKAIGRGEANLAEQASGSAQ